MEKKKRIAMQVLRLAGREQEVGARRAAKTDDFHIPAIPVYEHRDRHGREGIAASGRLDHERLLWGSGFNEILPDVDEHLGRDIPRDGDRAAARDDGRVAAGVVVKIEDKRYAKPDAGNQRESCRGFQVCLHERNIRRSTGSRQGAASSCLLAGFACTIRLSGAPSTQRDLYARTASRSEVT